MGETSQSLDIKNKRYFSKYNLYFGKYLFFFKCNELWGEEEWGRGMGKSANHEPTAPYRIEDVGEFFKKPRKTNEIKKVM